MNRGMGRHPSRMHKNTKSNLYETCQVIHNSTCKVWDISSNSSKLAADQCSRSGEECYPGCKTEETARFMPFHGVKVASAQAPG